MDENRELLAKNLHKFLRMKNKTQVDLANDLGLSPSTVSDWFNGKKYPRIDRLQELADYFGVFKSDLTEEKGSLYRTRGYMIPVLGEVPCGVPIEAIEYIIDYEEISEEMAKKGKYFGLKAKGDSMSPMILEGDTLIVRQQESAESGDIAILKVNGDEATCKKIIYSDYGLSLIPLNSSYSPSIYTSDQIIEVPLTIVGRVVEIRREV